MQGGCNYFNESFKITVVALVIFLPQIFLSYSMVIVLIYFKNFVALLLFLPIEAILDFFLIKINII